MGYENFARGIHSFGDKIYVSEKSQQSGLEAVEIPKKTDKTELVSAGESKDENKRVGVTKLKQKMVQNEEPKPQNQEKYRKGR